MSVVPESKENRLMVARIRLPVGIPRQARIERAGVDAGYLNLVLSHPSFKPVNDGDVIPEIQDLDR